MVSCYLKGRTANQAFIIAATIGYAIKHGLEFHVPNHTNDNTAWPPQFIHLTNNNWNPDLPTIAINEDSHAYSELPFEEDWRNKNIILGSPSVESGYFQSEKYFSDYIREVRRALGFSDWFTADLVGIHVRRTDYLKYSQHHPPCKEEYFIKAMDYMIKQKGLNKFKIFSDDKAWAYNFFSSLDMFTGLNITYSNIDNPIRDFEELLKCGHFIISNSTFSLMPAILNANTEKICISPSADNWFGVLNSHLSTASIVPESFIQIKY